MSLRHMLRNKILTLDDIFGVSHHIRNYKQTAREYLASNLRTRGSVLVKDMNDRNVICKYFNRMHDMIMARELIREVPIDDVKKISYVPLKYYEKAGEGLFCMIIISCWRDRNEQFWT